MKKGEAEDHPNETEHKLQVFNSSYNALGKEMRSHSPLESACLNHPVCLHAHLGATWAQRTALDWSMSARCKGTGLACDHMSPGKGTLGLQVTGSPTALQAA